MNAQSKHWFSLDTEREYMPSKNLTCPICGDQLNPPTRHSCNWAGGIDVTDEETWETIGAPEPEPDYPTIDEMAWDDEGLLETLKARALEAAKLAGQIDNKYRAWLDAQNEETGLRYNCGGW